MNRVTELLGDTCLHALEKGYDWIFAQQKPDGSLGTAPTDEPCFYNTLYSLSLSGRPREFGRFVAWMRKNVIGADGTHRVDPDGILATKEVYLKAWNVFGSHSSGFYDMSLKAVDVLFTYQDQRSGGFYECKSGRDCEDGLVELCTSGIAGLACLATGSIKQAVAAGDFHVDLLAKQPNLDEGIYGYMDPRRGTLITSELDLGDSQQSDNAYGGGKSGDRPNLDPYLFHYDTRSDEVGAYANLGPPLAFLCHLHQATGAQSYRDAAMKIFQCLDAAGDKCWVKGQSTKVLWGMVRLFELTGDRRVLGGIERLAGHLCEAQLPDGRWLATIAFDDVAKQPTWVSLAIGNDVLLSLTAVLRCCG